MEKLTATKQVVMQGVKPDKIFLAMPESVSIFIKNLENNSFLTCSNDGMCTKIFYNRNLRGASKYKQRLENIYNEAPLEPHFQGSLDKIYQDLKCLISIS